MKKLLTIYLMGLFATATAQDYNASKISEELSKNAVAVIRNEELFFDFKAAPEENYTFTILPGALTNYLEQSNDTLVYKINTSSLSDYGNLTVDLKNVNRFPVIIELTNEKGEALALVHEH